MKVTATRYKPDGQERVIVSFYAEQRQPSTLFLDENTWELLAAALAASPHFEVNDTEGPQGSQSGGTK